MSRPCSRRWFLTPAVGRPPPWPTRRPCSSRAQPLRALGGAVFAINALILFSTGVAFAGSFRRPSFRVSIPRHRLRPGLHVLGRQVVQRRRGTPERPVGVQPAALACLVARTVAPGRRSRRRWVWVCGLVWGLMINALLQSVLIGAVVFLVLGRSLGSVSTLKRLAGVALIALVVAAPSWLPFVIASRQSGMALADASHISFWGASLNSLFIPSLLHPVAFVRDLANGAYSGLITAAVKGNLGLVTAALWLAGAIIALRQRGSALRFAGLALASLVLAMGLLLNWNGEPVASSLFTPLNEWIWQVGRQLKPRVFDWLAPPPAFERGIPLPALLRDRRGPALGSGPCDVAICPGRRRGADSLDRDRASIHEAAAALAGGRPVAPGGTSRADRQLPLAPPGSSGVCVGRRAILRAGRRHRRNGLPEPCHGRRGPVRDHVPPPADGLGRCTFWPLASIPLRDFIEINARTALENRWARPICCRYTACATSWWR